MKIALRMWILIALAVGVGEVVPAHGQATAPAAPATQPKAITVATQISPRALDMAALTKNQMGYTPTGLVLVADKPAAIVKEPAYRGVPKYGAIRIGNGPRNITYFAVDETKGEPGRLFMDLNQNGDLTDDGTGAWDTTKETDGVLNYSSIVALHASWGNAITEEEGGAYTIMIYKRHGASQVGYVKLSARSGKLELGGKSYDFLLSENTNDGIFTVPAPWDRTRRPVDLLIDLDGDGTFTGAKKVVDGKTMVTPERYSLNTPIYLDGQWWLGRPTASGSELLLSPTSAPGSAVPTPVATESRSLLADGVTAPDFTAQAPDGKPVKLSDFKGKIVILDFWATWCGPCKVSMPGLQKIYDGVRDQGVVVLSVNVWDDKDPFDAWIAANSGKVYNFTFAFDPAGRDTKTSIAASKFGVSGIPTMYVIGRDGKVAAAIVGSGNEKTLTKVLTEQGIKVKSE